MLRKYYIFKPGLITYIFNIDRSDMSLICSLIGDLTFIQQTPGFKRGNYLQ